LQRVIEIAPDDERAHLALGHTKADGQWTTPHELMTKRGYQWFQGRWRTPQEVEILKEKREFNKEEKLWMQKLDRWIAALGSDRADEARAAIVAIQEPAAIKGLGVGLTSHADPRVRAVLAEALAALGTKESLTYLAESAIDDGNEEVRLTCLDFLKKQKNPAVIGHFVARLNDKDNGAVNRAAMALRVMGDPSAIGPLIDHLITSHKFKLAGGNPGQMSSTFGTGPKGGAAPGGLSVGGGPKFVTQRIQNVEVLDALIALTGQAALGYNVGAWRAWYAAQKHQEAADVRRGK
jgi:HEAT repeat protein